MDMGFDVFRLGPGDDSRYREMLALFAEAFHDPGAYLEHPPGPDYVSRLLSKDDFVALAAVSGDRVVGALVAYELVKFEQERSEFYLYDLAVAESVRRTGVATSLIQRLQEVARGRGAWVIFVQADQEDEDLPAIALYSKLGIREEVLHFDLPVNKN